MHKIAFAGGGTGGHVFPIKSLIEYIFEKKEINGKFAEIYWFGEKESLENKICSQISNVKFVSIYSGKFRRDKDLNSLLLNLADLFKFLFGIVQSMFFLIKYNIDVVFCKGGYVALPVVVAGKLLGKKIFLHESDTIPGLTNKIASKISKINFTGFPNGLKNSIHVGQIFSYELSKYSANQINLSSNIDIQKTNILLMGGSQGSKAMYEGFLNILETDLELQGKYNVFVILGLKNTELKKRFEKLKNITIFDFVSQKEIGFLYNISDLSLTRGSSAIAEQKLFNNKLFIVPLPNAGGNHQYRNAKYFEKQYDDKIILQDKYYESNLKKLLVEYCNFKKEIKENKDIDLSIEYSKKIIITNILKYIN